MPAVKTPPGLLSFPHLFVPRSPARGVDARYSIALLFDPAAQKRPEFKALKDAVFDVIAEQWGDNKAKDAKFIATLRLPWSDAGSKDYEGYVAGHLVIQPWSKDKPGLIDVSGADILAPADVWAGQIARAFVNPFAYENSGNKGVSLGLQHVQILKADMPRIDGRKSAKDAFDDDLSEFTSDMPF